MSSLQGYSLSGFVRIPWVHPHGYNLSLCETTLYNLLSQQEFIVHLRLETFPGLDLCLPANNTTIVDRVTAVFPVFSVVP